MRWGLIKPKVVPFFQRIYHFDIKVISIILLSKTSAGIVMCHMSDVFRIFVAVAVVIPNFHQQPEWQLHLLLER